MLRNYRDKIKNMISSRAGRFCLSFLAFAMICVGMVVMRPVETKAAGTATLKTGEEVNVAIKKLVNSSVTYYSTDDTTITEIKLVDTAFTSSTDLATSGSPVYARLNGTVVEIYSDADKIYANADSGRMFKDFNKLVSVPFVESEKFDTSKVTDMSWMFDECLSLTSLDVSHFNTSNVTDMGVMFYDCSKLTFLDLSKFNTSNITRMSNMFYDCSSLTSLDVSHFNTSNVTSMSSMFYKCSSLTSLDVSKFNTSNVTYMSSMFSGCSSLTSLDVSHFDTSKVTSMQYMFDGCSKLTSLDVSHFDTSNVTTMSGMFSGCSSLTSLDISHFNTSNVTSMSSMFNSCFKLTSLDVSHFNTSNVTYMSSMFSSCSFLTSLDVSKFNTSNVTNMNSMFCNCLSVTSLDVSHFNTSEVTQMYSMFKGCSKLTSLDVSHFDTSNVTYMEDMFYECRSVTSLDVSHFDISNVTYMKNMFFGCSSLTSLDVSNFDMSKVTKMTYMFNGCASLKMFIAPKTIPSSLSIGFGPGNWYLDDAEPKLEADSKMKYTTLINDVVNTPHTYIRDNIEGFSLPVITATLVSGKDFNAAIKKLVNSSATYSTNDTTITEIKLIDTAFTSSTNLAASGSPVYARLNGTVVEIYSDADKIYANADSGHMFENMTGLKQIDFLSDSRFYADDVTNMGSMFKGCSSLESLNLSKFDLTNVTDISSMLDGCNKLQAVTSPHTVKSDQVITLPVKSGYVWYLDDNNDYIIDSNQTYTEMINNTLGESHSYIRSDHPDFKLFSVTLKSGENFNVLSKQLIDGSASSYSAIDTSISNVEQVASSFVSDVDASAANDNTVPAIAKIISRVAYSHTDNVSDEGVDDGEYGNNLSTVDSVRLPGATSLHVTLTYGTEDGYDGLYVYEGEYTGNVEYDNMSDYLEFYEGNGDEPETVEFDVTGDTVTFAFCSDVSYGYYGYYAVVEGVGLPTDNGYDVLLYSKAVNLNLNPDCSHMFENMTGLKQIDFLSDSHLCADDVTNMGSMFKGCGSLAALDLSKFDLTNVTDISSMLDGCNKLQTVTSPHTIKSDQVITLPAKSGYAWYLDDNNDYIADSNQTYTEMINNTSGESHSYIRSDYPDFEEPLPEGVVKRVKSYGIIWDLYSDGRLVGTGDGHDYLGNVTIESLGFTLADIKSIHCDCILYQDCSNLFKGCTKATSFTTGDNFSSAFTHKFYQMFHSCESMTTMDFAAFNTISADNELAFAAMFDKCKNIEELDLSSFDARLAGSVRSMFYDCTKLKTINFGENFVTSNLTDITYLFTNASSLTEVDLSGFDLRKLTSSNYATLAKARGANDVFKSATNITKVVSPAYTNSSFNINLPTKSGCSWYIDDDGDMRADETQTYTRMDAGHTYIRSDREGFNTTPLVKATLKSGKDFNLALKQLVDPAAVWSSEYPYAPGDNTITSIELVSIKWFTGDTMPEGTVNVAITGSVPVYARLNGTVVNIYSDADKICANADSGYMFVNFGGVTSLSFAESERFDTSNVTDMYSMFYNCSSFTSLDVSKFNTSNVMNMGYMFSNCSKLTSLDVSKFNTSNVTDMHNMFNNCSSLISLDVSHFNTSKVTDMGLMFYCSSLTSLDVSEFDTSNVTDMSYMFSNCSSLTSLNVSNFDTSKVTRMDGMFAMCSSLAALIAPKTIPSSLSVDLPSVSGKSWYLDDAEPKLQADSKTKYTTLINDVVDTPHTYIRDDIEGFSLPVITTTLKSGKDFNLALKQLVDPAAVLSSSYPYAPDDNTITSIELVSSTWFTGDTMPEGTVNVAVIGSVPVYARLNGTVVEIYSDADKIYANANSEYMFACFKKLVSLPFVESERFDTSNVTNMQNMFYYCSSLTSLDVSNFNTSNVINMFDMFYSCSSLTSLDVSHFDTPNVTDMNHMFSFCSSLASLTLGDFDTSNITNMCMMFYYCSSLTSLDVSKFDTSNVTDMESMFSDCSSLTSLDVSHFDTSKVTDMSDMFKNCSSLTSLDVSHFDTSNVTDMNYMFYGCQSLTSLDVSHFNTSNVTNMHTMFFNCSSLISLDVSHFDTSNVTDMNYMFAICSSLTSLDLSNFNTSNVTDMGDMFSSCSKLTSLDVSHFDTSNVTTMYDMFSFCSSLASLNLGDFDTSNVTDMHGMFEYCSKLTSLDVSHFDTPNVTDMNHMFYNCSSLTSLDLSNFDMSNVTNASGMFYWCDKLYIIIAPKTIPDTISVDLPSDAWYLDDELPKMQIDDISVKYDQFINGVENQSHTYVRLCAEISAGYGILPSGIYSTMVWKYLSGLPFDDSPTELITARDRLITNIKWVDTPFGVGEDVVAFFDSNSDVLDPLNGSRPSVINISLSPVDFIYARLNGTEIELYTESEKVIFSDARSDEIDVSKIRGQDMFYNMAALESVDFLSDDRIVSTALYDVGAMFSGCTALTILDLSRFALINTTDSDDSSSLPSTTMFHGTVSLQKFKAPKTVSADVVIPLPSAGVGIGGPAWYLDDNDDLQPDSTDTYANLIAGVTDTPHTYIRSDIDGFTAAWTYLMDGRTFNRITKSLIAETLLAYDAVDFDITKFVWVDEPFVSDCKLSISGSQIYARLSESGIIELYTAASDIYVNSDCAYMFYNMRNLNSIEFLQSLSMDYITSADHMFSRTGLQSFAPIRFFNNNLTACDTSNMFFGCENLEYVGITNPYERMRVNKMNGMFAMCPKLRNISLLNFDLTDLTSADSMYAGSLNICNVWGPAVISDSVDVFLPAIAGYAWYLDDTGKNGRPDDEPDSDVEYIVMTAPGDVLQTGHHYIRQQLYSSSWYHVSVPAQIIMDTYDSYNYGGEGIVSIDMRTDNPDDLVHIELDPDHPASTNDVVFINKDGEQSILGVTLDRTDFKIGDGVSGDMETKTGSTKIAAMSQIITEDDNYTGQCVITYWGRQNCIDTVLNNTRTITDLGYIYNPTGSYPVIKKDDEMVTELDIPATYVYDRRAYRIVRVDNGVFKDCRDLESVTLPDSIDIIGESAFENCVGLTYFVIPDNVTKIGDKAFAGTSIDAILFDGRVYTDPDEFNAECIRLGVAAYVDYDGNVIDVAEDDTEWAAWSKAVNVPGLYDTTGRLVQYNGKPMTWDNLVELGVSLDGVDTDADDFDDEDVPNARYFYNRQVGLDGFVDYFMHSEATESDRETIKSQTGMTDEELEVYIRSSADQAFSDFDEMFNSSLSLTGKLILPDGVTSIGDYTFAYCTGLTSVYIPASVTDIGSNAFLYCFGMDHIEYGGTAEQWNAIAFGEDWNDACLVDKVICADGTEIPLESGMF